MKTTNQMIYAAALLSVSQAIQLTSYPHPVARDYAEIVKESTCTMEARQQDQGTVDEWIKIAGVLGYDDGEEA